MKRRKIMKKKTNIKRIPLLMLMIMALMVTMAVPAFASPEQNEEVQHFPYEWEVLPIEEAFAQGWEIFDIVGATTVEEFLNDYSRRNWPFDGNITLNSTWRGLWSGTGPQITWGYVFVMNFAESPGTINARIRVPTMVSNPEPVPRGHIARLPVNRLERFTVEVNATAVPNASYRIRSGWW
jgi:hypothetical protein